MTILIANLPEEQQATTVEFANFKMDDDAFYDFCLQNDHLKFERNADGTIIAMPNTGGIIGIRNAKLTTRLVFGQNPLAVLYLIPLLLLNCLMEPRVRRMRLG